MSTRDRPVVVVGDSLLDRDILGSVARLAPDAPVPVLDEQDAHARPGGAALAAALLARTGRRVRLVTAICDDDAGAQLRDLLAAEGVEVVALASGGGSTPVKTRLVTGERVLLRWDRGGLAPLADDHRPDGDGVAGAVDGAGAVLVSDYGGVVCADAGVRAALAAFTRDVPVVWDPHRRGASPVPGCAAVTPNLVEARALVTPTPIGAASAGSPVAAAADLAAQLRAQWRASSVVVTLGSGGALLSYGDGAPLVVDALRIAAPVDACGAGDRFAGELAARLADGMLVSEALVASVTAAGRFVAAGGAGAWRPAGPATAATTDTTEPGPDGETGESGRTDGATGVDRIGVRRPPMADVLATVRGRSGVVVATGGVFDLLHAGHVRYLERARALGDALVVLVNDDDSVRRLKGPQRPLQPLADRMAVLESLAAVDAVVPFTEDTPVAALQLVRPDLWVKGGDYTGATLPETPVVESWGGRVVVVPYLDGRSTTRLIRRARHGVSLTEGAS